MRNKYKYNTVSTPSGLSFAFDGTPTGCTGGYSLVAPSGQNKTENSAQIKKKSENQTRPERTQYE